MIIAQPFHDSMEPSSSPDLETSAELRGPGRRFQRTVGVGNPNRDRPPRLPRIVRLCEWVYSEWGEVTSDFCTCANWSTEIDDPAGIA